jgi:ribosomal protein S18 acetylase RimI-like enzyme
MDSPKNTVIRTIRLDDYDRVVEIDLKITGMRRLTYYRRKLYLALNEKQRIITSLVAEVEGHVVGFIMGDVFIGEFGVPDAIATIDTIAVDPDYQRQGIAQALMNEYITAVKKAGVEKVVTYVQWKDMGLLRFFHSQRFALAPTLQLELPVLPK